MKLEPLTYVSGFFFCPNSYLANFELQQLCMV